MDAVDTTEFRSRLDELCNLGYGAGKRAAILECARQLRRLGMVVAADALLERTEQIINAEEV